MVLSAFALSSEYAQTGVSGFRELWDVRSIVLFCRFDLSEPQLSEISFPEFGLEFCQSPAIHRPD